MSRGEVFTFLKYLTVGILNTIVGLSVVLVLFNILKLDYWIATSVGNIIGVVVSFYLNKRYTFKYNGSSRNSVLKFLLVSFLSYIIAYTLGFYISGYFKGVITNLWISENLSILISSGLYTILGFIGHKKISFISKPVEET